MIVKDGCPKPEFLNSAAIDILLNLDNTFHSTLISNRPAAQTENFTWDSKTFAKVNFDDQTSDPDQIVERAMTCTDYQSINEIIEADKSSKKPGRKQIFKIKNEGVEDNKIKLGNENDSQESSIYS